ncbi:hypothetical protein CXF72_14185 [Psychromonas sp. MB-3u-54]|uniref:hypothetical protein n=1 Tax=Psychromonas sp. MB-3u-54 TaxID=2058319 RepID=UPI000C34F07A|nr:hypothetical protein [Psychromonas sp. MB-3u-54]PKH01952.1 hypothetical protein CXF72_14185 [Psychromonas sp. MB-3u-54]
MLFFRRNLFICYLLVVALLTSVFAVGSANNFTYPNVSSASLLKITTPILACKYYNKLEIRQKCRQAWYDVIKAININSKTPQNCERLINVVTLFPATAVAKLHKAQAFSRALITEETMGNPHSFSEILYRPPIG